MKKVLSLVMLVVLALTALTATAAAESNAWVKLPDVTGSLHVRKGPSKSTDSAGYVKHGDAIFANAFDTGTDGDGETWINVIVEKSGVEGYIKTKYVSYEKVESAQKSSSTSAYVCVSSSGGTLNLRKGPGTSFGVEGYVKHGDAITVVEKGSEWSKIKTSSGKTGYIKTKYIASSKPSTPSTPVSDSYDVAVVATKTSGGTVNLRKGAGTGYGVVVSLGRGTVLAVIGRDGNWYKVKTLSGKTGYISKNYISFGAPAVTTANLNMRKGAGTGYAVLRSLSKGSSVTVNSVSGKWANVTYKGKTGYVSTNYLKWK